MQGPLTSKRLSLTKLSLDDADFIFELVNTAGWLKFIGDRNVKTPDEARLFVLKVMNNPHVDYWVVRTLSSQTLIGIVSFVKREYLDFYDVGFAFLPQHSKQGFALEATTTFLQHLAKESSDPKILATTINGNSNSIALLIKLGFQFEKRIMTDNEELQVYSISMDQFLIDQLTKSFFEIFTNLNASPVNLNQIFDLCLPETLIIKKSSLNQEVYSLQTFIDPRQKILTDGTLTSFEEKEITGETKMAGAIAQRFSKYEKKGCFSGKSFEQKGNKFFHFVKTAQGWKISSVVWEDEEN
jgi:RimJ/RimL family protein N-acetyltransferase